MKSFYQFTIFLLLSIVPIISAFTVAIPETELEFLREVIGPEEEIEVETKRQKNLTDYICYENGHKNNEFWALRWEDQFKKPQAFEDWAMVVENKYCSGKFLMKCTFYNLKTMFLLVQIKGMA